MKLEFDPITNKAKNPADKLLNKDKCIRSGCNNVGEHYLYGFGMVCDSCVTEFLSNVVTQGDVTEAKFQSMLRIFLITPKTETVRLVRYWLQQIMEK